MAQLNRQVYISEFVVEFEKLICVEAFQQLLELEKMDTMEMRYLQQKPIFTIHIHYMFTTMKYTLQSLKHHRIRKIQPNGIITTIAGAGNHKGCYEDGMLAIQTNVNIPAGIFVDTDSQVYIVDYHHCMRRIDQNGMMRGVVGTGAN